MKKIEKVFLGLYVVALMAVLSFVFDGAFTINDDIFLRKIFSGDLTGTPEWITYYVSGALGVVVSTLYRLSQSVPWFVVYQVCSVGLMLYLVTVRGYEKCFSKVSEKRWLQAATAGIFCTVLTLFVGRWIVFQTYTTMTMLIAAGACFLLVTADYSLPKKVFLKENRGAILLTVLAVGIRANAFLILLPMMGMILLGKFIFALVQRQKSIWQNILVLGGIELGIVALIAASSAPALGNESWRDYQRYNEARTVMQDYYGRPEYEAAKAICEKYGVTEESYQLFTQAYCLILDENMTTDFMEELAELPKPRTREAWQEYYDREYKTLFSRGTDRSPATAAEWLQLCREQLSNLLQRRTEKALGTFVAQEVLVFGLAVLAILVLKRSKEYIAYWFLSLSGTLVSILYLFLKGRVLDRVTDGIWLAQFFVLLAFLLMVLREGVTGRAVKAVTALILCGSTALLIQFGRLDLQWAIKSAEGANAFYRCNLKILQEELREYDEDTVFLADISSFMWFAGPVWEAMPEDRLVWLGTWDSAMPYYDRILRDLQESSWSEAALNGKAYFVVQEACIENMDYIYAYLEKKYGEIEAEVVEAIETRDAVFQVISVKRRANRDTICYNERTVF